MSEYNKNTSSNFNQTVPGTPMQQMWQVLNFHEERLKQLTQHLLAHHATTSKQIETLTARVNTLESESKKVTLSIEE
jgi:hypothetical protein